jgi:hypothetical protein
MASVTKTFTLKGVQTIHLSGVEQWIVCTTPLNINIFVTLATQ